MHRADDRQRRRAERGVVGVWLGAGPRRAVHEMAAPAPHRRADRLLLFDPAPVRQQRRARTDDVAGAVIEIDVHPERERRPQRHDLALARLLVEIGNLDPERLQDRLRAIAADADRIAAGLVAAQQIPVAEQADLVDPIDAHRRTPPAPCSRRDPGFSGSRNCLRLIVLPNKRGKSSSSRARTTALGERLATDARQRERRETGQRVLIKREALARHFEERSA